MFAFNWTMFRNFFSQDFQKSLHNTISFSCLLGNFGRVENASGNSSIQHFFKLSLMPTLDLLFQFWMALPIDNGILFKPHERFAHLNLTLLYFARCNYMVVSLCPSSSKLHCRKCVLDHCPSAPSISL